MSNRQEPLQSDAIGLAFVFHTIKLNEGVDEQKFEKFMLDEIFPAVNTQRSGVAGVEAGPDHHRLLAGQLWEGDYIWMIHLEYFIHHTPLPNWLARRASESYASVADKIEAFGEKTTTYILYDVKEWHQRLGLDSKGPSV